MAIGIRTNVYKPLPESELTAAVMEIDPTAGGEIVTDANSTIDVTGTISVIGAFLGDD